MKRESFITEFGDVILRWAGQREDDILDYKSYRWKNKTYEESVKEIQQLRISDIEMALFMMGR